MYGMHRLRLILIYQLFLLALPCSAALKIGLAKPLPVTSPLPPTTTSETFTEEASAETASHTTEYLSAAGKTTTLSDTEWPDFPPRKPLQTSKKPTTETPSTTPIKAPTTAITPTITVKEKNITYDPATLTTLSYPKRPTTTQKYCFCDLTREACDINCCCDQDCSMEVLKVFRCQLENSIGFELEERRLEDFKFQHGLSSCEINDGWLCVFRTNQPVAKKEVATYLEDTSHYYKWPNLLLESEDVKQREFYKYGDLMRIINTETKEIQNFDLPSSFESSACRIREPIYYLKTTKKTCLISSYENLKADKLKLLQLERQYKIFKTPIIPDDIYNSKHLENFVANITVYKCLKTENNCTRYQNEDEQSEENYAMFEVKVNILHNFTHIQEVVVDLWFAEAKEVRDLKSFERDYYWLSYETEFFNKTLRDFKTSNGRDFAKTLTVSGPLGYLQGKPLIVARYVPFNRSQPLSTKNQVLNYFSPNNSAHHALSLMAKENGICKRSKSAKDLISYGINAAYYCKVKLANDSAIEEAPAHTNFTEKCYNLQQRIHEQLFGQDLVIEDISSYFISQLGRPQNNSNKWLPLQVYNTDFDAVLGQYVYETKTFVCRNILLSLSYEFHMATFTVDDIPLQNVIQRAVLHLDERHDLEFSLNENLEVPVTMAVRFYDVLEKAASLAACNLPKMKLIFCLKLCLIILYNI